MPPPPGYPANGALKQPASTKATRQAAAAVQTPATYPAYPNSYPPPAGYTYPPPPPGYGRPPQHSAPPKATTKTRTPAKTSSTTRTPAKTGSKTTSSKKPTAAPPPAPKVYGPTGDLSRQVATIRDNDKVQNLRLGELERDVSSIKRSGNGTRRYDGGSDIAAHTSYVARPGDTLFRIASTHRVSVGEIQQLNRMTQDEVRVGQTLLIPSPHRISLPATTQASYKPSTPGGGGARYISTPARADTATNRYTVRKGDSLKAIAIKHKMTTAALASANKIKDANKIFVGQSLVIPGRTVTTTTVTATPRVHVPDDTVPLPDYDVPSAPPPPVAGLGLTPAPAPPPVAAPAPPAPTKTAGNVHDTHRGILAYRVDRSDTLESIAQQFSTTPDQIRQINHLQAGTPLKAGDEIMVPAMGAVSVR